MRAGRRLAFACPATRFRRRPAMRAPSAASPPARFGAPAPMSPEREKHPSAPRLDHVRAGLRCGTSPAAPAGLGVGVRARRLRLAADRREARLAHAVRSCAGDCGRRTVAVVLGYSTITGLDGGTALLALMSALKLLETRTPATTRSSSSSAGSCCLASFLYAGHRDRRGGCRPSGCSRRRCSRSRAAARGAPRARPLPHRRRHAAESRAGRARPLLLLSAGRGQLLGRALVGAGVTGLTEEMSPGDISDLTLNDVVAFRVRFKGDRRRGRCATGAASC